MIKFIVEFVICLCAIAPFIIALVLIFNGVHIKRFRDVYYCNEEHKFFLKVGYKTVIPLDYTTFLLGTLKLKDGSKIKVTISYYRDLNGLFEYFEKIDTLEIIPIDNIKSFKTNVTNNIIKYFSQKISSTMINVKDIIPNKKLKS